MNLSTISSQEHQNRSNSKSEIKSIRKLDDQKVSSLISKNNLKRKRHPSKENPEVDLDDATKSTITDNSIWDNYKSKVSSSFIAFYSNLEDYIKGLTDSEISLTKGKSNSFI